MIAKIEYNLKCMKLDVIKSFVNRHNIRIIKLTYFGSFQHADHQGLVSFQEKTIKIYQKAFKLYFNKLVEKYPSRNFLSAKVAIFEKV